MPEHPPSPLEGWSDFYVIVGAGGAALTGLMFIVITLAADRRTGTQGTNAAYATPTVVHLFVVLLLSAFMAMPGHGGRSLACGLAAFGAWGIAYVAVVVGRMRRQRAYTPVVEDWLWHAGVPGAGYVALVVAAAVALRHVAASLYVVAACVGVLLAAGMHNAWDAATYIVTTPKGGAREPVDGDA